MRTPLTARGTALAAAAALTVSLLTACQDGEGDRSDSARPASPSATAPSSAGPSSAPPSAGALPASLTGQRIAWRACGAPTVNQGGGDRPQPLNGTAWECGTLKAPLDWAEPGGETIGVAMIRAKAARPKERVGSLVFNFGGPGGSGVSILPSLAADDYGTLHKAYDLVSFDPRGVGESSGVRCLTDAEMDAEEAGDSTPDTAAEERRLLADAKEVAAKCAERAGRMLPHVDTASAARDLDLMRQVLGDRKLNYFGVSYGTELGGVYAHLFPRNVGRTVFDAVVDPTQDDLADALGNAEGFELALDHFVAACDEQTRGNCPIDSSEDLAGLLEDIDAEPLPTDDGDRRLTEDAATMGVVATLYDQEYWPALAQGLNEVRRSGEGTTLLTIADAYTGRDEQGRYDTSTYANIAVNCADSGHRYTVADVRAHLPEFREASAAFGDALAWSLLGCTDWPVTGRKAPLDVSAPGAGPILVIGNTGDPATPYAGAKRMADGLGEGVGVHLTVRGEGHGTYGVNDCLTAKVDAYLLDGTVPADGTTCRS
ncbi:alpha/beta fold hydrolase [Streptomyces capparidis]